MPVVRVTDAASEPVTLAEAKAHCRIDIADDDAIVSALIVAARQMAEQETGRALITQVFRLTAEAFPTYALVLPFPTLQSVATIKYYDTDGTLQTLSAGAYRVDTAGEQVTPVDVWPATQVRPDAIEVNYSAGWTSAGAVPSAIKQWVLMHVAAMYDNRAAVGTARDAMATRLPFVDGLLAPYRSPIL